MNVQATTLPKALSSHSQEFSQAALAEASYLRLSLNQTHQILLPANCLSEITCLTLPQIVPIPDMSPQVMGVCEWRGEVLWLIDLAAHLGFPPLYRSGYRQSEQNMLVIHHQGIHLGLVVYRAHQIQNYSEKRMREDTAETRLVIEGYLVKNDNVPLPVLDCGAVINSLG
ncbi:MAG: chemotaxis protein CheW [Cyanobacteria bacterium J06626_23]